MAPRPSRLVLSLQGVPLAERHTSSALTRLDLDLPRGNVILLQVDDEADASELVDLCAGLADPHAGRVHFLGVDWTTRTPSERMHRRRRIGAVIQSDAWPAHVSVIDAVLLAGAYHFDRPHAEMIDHATELARLFGLPGLPSGRRETTPRRALIRAACVRGFLGTPDLVVVQDQALEQTPDLAVPMAQAVSAARDRGAAILWIAASLTAPAAQFVEPDQVLRLSEHGLVPVRRTR
jgi:phospholipid/cholesterol/gamma-HCH transport system ATP-binding protein